MKRSLIQLACVALALAAFGCTEQPKEHAAFSSDASPTAAQPAPESADTYVAHNDHSAEAESTEETTIGSTTASLAIEPTAGDGSDQPRALAFNPILDIDGAPRVSVDDVQRLEGTETVHLLDVRPFEAFAFEHAIDSINIPSDEIYERYAEIPRDGIIVAICT